MIHEYIAKKYERGQDDEARRAIAKEIVRGNTPDGEPPTYQPTDAEIGAVEAEYYASRRIRLYGRIGAQLDEQYHDYDAWKARIAAVKEKIAKS